MITKAAIEKAIEGGWKSDEPHIALGAYEDGEFFGGQAHWKWKPADGGLIKRISVEAIALDPTFWKALGKALEWDKERWEMYLRQNDPTAFSKMPFGVDTSIAYGTWFTHLILTGGDTEKFWEELGL